MTPSANPYPSSTPYEPVMRLTSAGLRVEAIRLLGQGVTPNDVAATLMVSPQRIYQIRKEHDLKAAETATRLATHRRSSNADPDQIVALWAAGASMRAIADQTLVPVPTISAIVKGTPGGPAHRAALNKAEVIRRYLDGEEVPSIISDVATSSSRAYQWLKGAGIELRPRKRHVTPTETKVEVRAAFESGVPVKALARRYDRTTKTIRNWIKATGGTVISEVPTKDVLRLWRRGMSASAIAEQMGTNHHRIIKMTKGVEGGPQRANRRDRAKSITLYTNGMPIHAIARTIDRSPATISSWLKVEGLVVTRGGPHAGLSPQAIRDALRERSRKHVTEYQRGVIKERQMQGVSHKAIARETGVSVYWINVVTGGAEGAGANS